MGNALHPKQWPSKFYATLKRTDICKLSTYLRRLLWFLCVHYLWTQYDLLVINKRHQHVASNRGVVRSETDTDSFVSLLMIFVSCVFACIAAIYLHQQFRMHLVNSRWPFVWIWVVVLCLRVGFTVGNVFVTSKYE